MKQFSGTKFKVETLGCKLNQFDSAVIEGELIRRKFLPCMSREEASIVIINTCTVTGKADYQSRRLIRKVRRENPDCTIIVTGCYARLDPDALRALPEANMVIDVEDEKAPRAIVEELTEMPVEMEESGTDIHDARVPDIFETHFSGRTRAFLKIQDGCDLKCSYCIIPRVRGKSRSAEPRVVIDNVKKLIKKGFREIVLTGVNSGDYGRDLSQQTSLLRLLREIVRIEDLGRVRLNSLEPPTIPDDLIDLIASTEKIAHHLHVPLQSGCDRTLKMMYRPYRTWQYSRIVEQLRERIPDIGIGTDVIVGFPGETDEDFEQTYSFIENSPINFLHVFPFSKRPDTPASRMQGEVNGKVIKERVSLLRKLGENLRYRFRQRFQGKILDIIILGEKRDDGRYRALSGNYIEIGVDARPNDVNRIFPCRIISVSPDDTLGQIVYSH
ncbi:MAG: tRNA (N(6)-L-threonylcarbamoyladenosine(37)-C(2))-methylthiotransferase MtaB [Acidobacteriota bacterium]